MDFCSISCVARQRRCVEHGGSQPQSAGLSELNTHTGAPSTCSLQHCAGHNAGEPEHEQCLLRLDGGTAASHVWDHHFTVAKLNGCLGEMGWVGGRGLLSVSLF
jgi:hypothetical protein